MNDLLKEVYSAEKFREQGHEVVDMLADYLSEIALNPSMPVLPFLPPEEMKDLWTGELKEKKISSSTALLKEIVSRSIHIHHPGYMGHQVCAPAPITALASLVTDLLNNGTGIYEMGQVGSMMEFAIIDILAKTMGFGEDSGGFLTSGGTLANLTALLAARGSNTEVWEKGNEKKYALMVSEQAHYSVDRAARIMGWGEGGIIKIPTDAQYRIRVDLLDHYYEKAKESGWEVIAVVASSCSTATGSFDDINAIADFCERRKLWLHVDGAHGGALVFSDKYRHLLSGIHRADSVIMDFHKMLMTPVLSTAVVFKNEQDSYHTFHQKASYLFNNTEELEWFNLALRTFECTKNSLAIKIYSLLHSHGAASLSAITTHLCDRAIAFACAIQEHPMMELALFPECNIVCFRVVPPGLSPEETDAMNREIRSKIIEKGVFYLVQTQLNGRVYLRTTIISPFTEPKHFTALIDDLTNLAKC